MYYINSEGEEKVITTSGETVQALYGVLTKNYLSTGTISFTNGEAYIFTSSDAGGTCIICLTEGMTVDCNAGSTIGGGSN